MAEKPTTDRPEDDRTARIAAFPRPTGSVENALIRRYPVLTGYVFLTAVVVATFSTHLKIFVLSFLFLFLASDFLTNDVRRKIRFLPKGLLFSILYVVVLALLAILFWRVIPALISRLPQVGADVQAEVIKLFELADARWGVTAYVDEKEVRGAVMSATGGVVRTLYGSLTGFSRGFVYFLFALVANLLLYHNTAKMDAEFDRKPGTLMSYLYRFAMSRLRVFYFYFKRVMVGQAVISAVNTMISTVVIIGLDLPQPVLLIVVVFFCGLFPIVGNLVSNTILTVIALLSSGLLAAGICLIMLVGIHKLEYFLNSKIIGDIVHLPMFLTLTALVVCEVLLGVVGLILAIPLLLFGRHELELVPGVPNSPATTPPPSVSF